MSSVEVLTHVACELHPVDKTSVSPPTDRVVFTDHCHGWKSVLEGWRGPRVGCGRRNSSFIRSSVA